MTRTWLLVLAGCWGTPKPAQPVDPPAVVEPSPPAAAFRSRPKGPSHCERAVDHVVDVLGPELDRQPMVRDRVPQLRDTVVEGCVATAWTEDTLSCYDAIADASGINTCHLMLTEEQRIDLTRRMTDVLKQPP